MFHLLKREIFGYKKPLQKMKSIINQFYKYSKKTKRGIEKMEY